jgi:metal-responsive CopG/Arc/MetJ family transcriptional regulator
MSRPRSRDKAIPMSIAIPTSMMMKLENTLSYSSSRSAWVCDAIENKLLGMSQSNIADRTTRQLMAQLSMKEDCDATLKLILQKLLEPRSE